MRLRGDAAGRYSHTQRRVVGVCRNERPHRAETVMMSDRLPSLIAGAILAGLLIGAFW